MSWSSVPPSWQGRLVCAEFDPTGIPCAEPIHDTGWYCTHHAPAHVDDVNAWPWECTRCGTGGTAPWPSLAVRAHNHHWRTAHSTPLAAP